MQRLTLILWLLLVWLVVAVPRGIAQTAHSTPLAETLCTTDAIATGPLADNLAEGSHTVTVTWTSGSSSSLWFRIYRAPTSNGPWTLIADCIPGTSYVDTVGPSQTLYYQAAAIGAGLQQSGPSSEAIAAIPLFDTLVASNAPASTAQINETLSTSDALAVRAALVQAFQESLTTSDAFVAQHGRKLALSESLSTSDAVAPSGTFPVALAEFLTTSDALNAGFHGGVLLGETLGTLDALAVRSSQHVGIAETLSTSDALMELVTSRQATLTETLTTADLFSSSAALQAPPLAEQLTTMDALTLTGQPPGRIASNVAIFLLGSYGVAPAGSCGFELSIFGWGFSALSTANWNGSALQTTFISASEIEAAVTATDLDSAGQFPVTVTNPSGGVSQKRIFNVLPATPAIAGARIAGAAILVTGSNFVPTTTVFWNGLPLATTFISQTTLQAQPPAGVKAIGSNLLTVADTGCFF